MSMTKIETRLDKLETIIGSDDDVMICHWQEEPGFTEIGSIKLNGVEVVRGTGETREDFVKRACEQFNAKGFVWADLRSVWPNKIMPATRLEAAQ